MKAKIVIIAIVLAAGGLLLKALWPGRELPCILLITLDTTRADHLSCYGYKRKTTPNLDRLAQEGQRFEWAVAVSSWTLPTHASLFTGLHPVTHGAHYADDGKVSLSSAVRVGQQELYDRFKADGLPDSAVTLAEVLKAEGYATGGVGAGPWLKPVFGLSQGFETFDCNVVSVAGRRGDEVSVLAIQFLRRHRGEPFFLFLNYFDPHDPYTPPPELAFKFFPKEKVPRVREDPELAAEFEKALYDAEIFYMDQQIGRVLHDLKILGLHEDAWIIAIGDHGEMFGDHGLRRHGHSLFEGELRCPLIIKWPEGWEDLPPSSSRCQQMDIMPTILERLGLSARYPVEGRPIGAPPRPAVSRLYRNEGNLKTGGERFDRNLIALYSGSHKLILSSKEGDPDAGLFDLSRDPGELTDLSKEQPGKVEELQKLLNQWRRSLRPPLAPRRIESIDPLTAEQLEALGYGR